MIEREELLLSAGAWCGFVEAYFTLAILFLNVSFSCVAKKLHYPRTYLDSLLVGEVVFRKLDVKFDE